MWELPHTNQNFIQKEMGFVVARKHADKLRMLIVALAVALPLSIMLSQLAARGSLSLPQYWPLQPQSLNAGCFSPKPNMW